MKTAKAWGLIPSEWDDLSGDDKAEMMAFEESEDEIAAYWEGQRNG